MKLDAKIAYWAGTAGINGAKAGMKQMLKEHKPTAVTLWIFSCDLAWKKVRSFLLAIIMALHRQKKFERIAIKQD